VAAGGHVAERTAHHYLPIVYAMMITTCRTRAGSPSSARRAADVLRRAADLGEAQGGWRPSRRRRRALALLDAGRRV
jgi:hypothetical protein